MDSNKLRQIDNIISVKTLTFNNIIQIIDIAKKFQLDHTRVNYNRSILCTLFFEPSTRTACSFQAAMQRLGGSTITINEEFSSLAKGETFEDMIRTISSYADIIVLRHPDKNAINIACKYSNKPIINAGNGTDEHPTQALLDLFTIVNELDLRIIKSKLTIVFVGDLKNGRTVHSLIYLLAIMYNYNWKFNKEFPKIQFMYYSPPELELPDEVYGYVVETFGIEQIVVDKLEEAVSHADILYVTRIQKERFNNHTVYEKVKSSYCINKDIMTLAKSHMILMHPFPRVDEIDKEVDDDPRAVYFKQIENGLYVRMALIHLLLNQ